MRKALRWDCVLFDLDGTLMNTLGDLADACNWTLLRMGLPPHPEDAYRHFVGDGAAKLCERMLPPGRRDADTLQQARTLFDERYQEHLFDRTAPYDGILPLLSRLKEAEIPMGVVSNKPDQFVQKIAARYFAGMFLGVAGPKDGRVKPDPAGVLGLLQEIGRTPNRAVYIGDSGVDVQTAKNAGTSCCGAGWGFRGEAELRQAGAEYILAKPADFLPLIFTE